MGKIPAAILVGAILGASGFDFDRRGPRAKQNKYGLTELDLELIADMTPKEKKKFLRELKKP